MVRLSTFVRAASTTLIWATLALPTALLASAQDATPATAMPQATPEVLVPPVQVALTDAKGNAVGTAILSEYAGEVMVQVAVQGLPPGEHGWHLHAVGICDPSGTEPFASAGPHWNPTNVPHGAPDAPEHHVGDFCNVTVRDDGVGEATVTTLGFTLSPGPTSVFDDDSTAIIIHADQDDLTSQPAGNSGARLACGVVAAPQGTPTAQQAAATPLP